MKPDELCNQELVNEIFIPIKKKSKDNIEEIEFLFKNCCYNLNRMIMEINKISEEINVNPSLYSSEVLEKLPKGFELLKIRFDTVWEDMIVFEFQSFLTNFMRTINFLVKFDLKEADKMGGKYPTIGQFLHINNFEKYKDHFFYSEFRSQFDNWIKNVNFHRGDITHKYIIKEMYGFLTCKIGSDEKGNPKPDEKVTVGIKEYDIENFESYCKEKLDKLKDLINKYFQE